MKTPTIHLNGTSGQDLLDQVCNVSNALRTAITTMQAALPNGRDYYPQGDDALKAATAEHAARIEKIAAVLREYEALAESIADANDR